MNDQKLNVELREIRFGDCQRQDVNARFMRKEQFDALVANLKRDGVLTSVPLLFQVDDNDPLEIVSGHHRVEAGTVAFGEDAVFTGMVIRDEQSRQEIIARQLSHNAISGEDDPATLKLLYDELQDVDWRMYSGLDDKTLELLQQADLSSLAEANLDFQTVQISFLPPEKTAAEQAFEDARALVPAQARWIAALDQYLPTLDAIETARGAHGIGNIATALAIILEVFDRHIEDLAEGWWEQPHMSGKWIPTVTLLGQRIPADAATVILNATKKLREDTDDPNVNTWQALELIAADYLGNA